MITVAGGTVTHVLKASPGHEREKARDFNRTERDRGDGATLNICKHFEARKYRRRGGRVPRSATIVHFLGPYEPRRPPKARGPDGTATCCLPAACTVTPERCVNFD